MDTENITTVTALSTATTATSSLPTPTTPPSNTMVHGSWRTDGEVTHDDATWILTSAFIIFTMQSGFGLLESGSVSVKNELNIMVKNAVDVLFGGITYWAFGYALSFGNDGTISNPIVGWGDFFVTADEAQLGWIYSKFFFQASFATTATTIVSGAMAERTRLSSYMIFSMFNTILFSLPAHWVWATQGWLYTMGVVDVAGAGPVHLVGGITGLVATLILKPRHNRFRKKKEPQMSSPTNAVLGMFMLWWGWLGFNCGSTFGISGVKWKLAARSAATTLCASVSGGTVGLMLSYIVKDRRFDVKYMINGLLGSLVSVTAICALVQPWEGLLIGFVGSLIANGSVELLSKLKIDDPVGCVGTHAMTGVWGLLAAGLFSRKGGLLNALYLHNVKTGLFYGGGFHQLGVQMLAVVSIAAYSVTTSYIFLKLIDCTMGLRMPLVEEIIGADIVEHGLGEVDYDRKTGKLTVADYKEAELEDEELRAVYEMCIGRMRTHSISNVSHVLGHHVEREVGEITTELAEAAGSSAVESAARTRKRNSSLSKRLRNGSRVGERDENSNKKLSAKSFKRFCRPKNKSYVPNGIAQPENFTSSALADENSVHVNVISSRTDESVVRFKEDNNDDIFPISTSIVKNQAATCKAEMTYI